MNEKNERLKFLCLLLFALISIFFLLYKDTDWFRRAIKAIIRTYKKLKKLCEIKK